MLLITDTTEGRPNELSYSKSTLEPDTFTSVILCVWLVLLQPFDAASPEILYMVRMWLGLIGNLVVEGEVQGVSPAIQNYMAGDLASNIQTYYFLQSGEKYWENHMNQMLDKTIVSELVRTHQSK